jgi:hypothetical protein
MNRITSAIGNDSVAIVSAAPRPARVLDKCLPLF